MPAPREIDEYLLPTERRSSLRRLSAQGIGKVAGCGEAVVTADLLRAETYARTRTS